MGAQEAQSLVPGPLTKNQPITIRSLPFAGAKTMTYFDDYYNRIYLIPTNIDFGAIIGESSRSVMVWNAFLVNRTLQNIDEFNAEGLSLAADPLPKVFLPLQSRIYVVTASTSGPSDVDARYDFEFDNVTLPLPVIGTRGKVWPFPPNWSSPVSVQREYKTDIITSGSGKEQRRAIRQTPRKIIEFTSLIQRNQLRRFVQEMATWQDKPFTVPDYTRHVSSAAVMPPSTFDMELERMPSWVQPGAALALRYENRLDTRIVDEVNGNVVTFTIAAGLPWPVGTRVQPMLTAYVDMEIGTSLSTNAVMTIPTRFNIIPGTEVPPAATVAALTFDGRELFVLRPNWAQEVSLNFAHPVEQVDFDRGRIERFVPIKFGTITQQATYLNRDQEAGDAITDMFDRMKGRRGEFFMPTWRNDMDLRQDVSNGTFLLRVQGRDVLNNFKDDTVYKAVAILLEDGTLLPNLIQQMYGVDDIVGFDTIIEMKNAWPVDFDVDQIVMISWMTLCRFGSDGMTLEWLTDSVGQYQLTVQSLEYRASE